MAAELKNQELFFQRVESITTPGLYIFNETSIDNPPNIRGSHPQFEVEIPNYLLNRYPHRRINLVFPFQSWVGNSGIISLEEEYYEVLFGRVASGFLADKNKSREFICNLVDIGRPTSDYKNPVTILRPRGRDGRLNIRTYENLEDPNNPVWNGRLVLEGERPGLLIREALDYVNNVIRTSGIPVWARQK